MGSALLFRRSSGSWDVGFQGLVEVDEVGLHLELELVDESAKLVSAGVVRSVELAHIRHGEWRRID